MRRSRIIACIFVAAFTFSICRAAQQSTSARKMVVFGRLVRVMAIGAETTGWSIELKKEMVLDGKKVNSLEVSGNPSEFEKLVDRKVRAKGTIMHQRGMERGDHLVFAVESIRAVN